MYLAINHDNNVACLSLSKARAVKVVGEETQAMGDPAGEISVTSLHLDEAFLVSKTDMQSSRRRR